MRVTKSLSPLTRRASARIYYSSRNVISIHARSKSSSAHEENTNPKATNVAAPAPASSTDHHVLGKRLNLFSTTPYSAGSPLLHPDGSHLFLKLQSLLRAQHQAFGFQEVVSPTIYKQSLWEKSGHWQNYGDDMFEVVGRGARGQKAGKEAGEDEKWGLKPMNCPGHCLLYATETRSYRELPVRFADFSPLHRNEISGALTGLTRVRRFHQDDGHIFCRPDQVREEIAMTLKMVNLVYAAFGLKPHKLLLSTRPEESFIGTEKEWEEAESQLTSALEDSQLDWSLNPGDGAFYGPKIDIILRDNQGKEHQTATIQLDFQLPQRFQLKYDSDQPSTTTPSTEPTPASHGNPILIHRAILGSIERFMALLIEHYAGKWPFWLNPRQVVILTMNNHTETVQHAQQVAATLSGVQPANATHQLQPLSQQQYSVDIDTSAEPMAKKILRANQKGYGLYCVIGKKEMRDGNVSVTFPQHLVEGERLAVLEQRLNAAFPGIFAGEQWVKNRRILCAPETLRMVMGSMCDAWL